MREAGRGILGRLSGVLGKMYSDLGRSTRMRLVGGTGRVDVLCVEKSLMFWRGREGLEALEMESRSLWSLRFVVARAVGIVVGVIIGVNGDRTRNWDSERMIVSDAINTSKQLIDGETSGSGNIHAKP